MISFGAALGICGAPRAAHAVTTAAQGITLALQDSTLATVSHTFPVAECVTGSARISCRSADRNEKAKFQTSAGAPGLWKFSGTFEKVAVTGPFLGPTAARIAYGPGIDRFGTVSDCVTSFQKIRCREF